ncbi:hypothetical protein EMH43_37500, partial [Klebsiella pneumoniae]
PAARAASSRDARGEGGQGNAGVSHISAALAQGAVWAWVVCSCRPDKAFMPPSGTTTGTEPDRPAALRLRGPGDCHGLPGMSQRF